MDSQKSEQLWLAATEGNLSLVQQLSQDPSVNLNWQDDEFSRTPLCRASGHGRTEVVRFLLTFDHLDVNLPQKTGATPINVACQQGHVDVVSLLLADKRVDVNKTQQDGLTPFCKACQGGHVEVVSLLLEDDRVDVNQPTNDETSPLWFASQEGYLVVIQYILASAKGGIDTGRRSEFNMKTAAEQARVTGQRTLRPQKESEEDFMQSRQNCPKIADLIDTYEKDPGRIRAGLRRELGIDESLAGELFSLVIYLSDEYLEIPRSRLQSSDGKEKEKENRARKFFSIALQLPMDLQMVLCNRVFGLEDSIIKAFRSEKGFRKFAKGY